MLRWWHQWGPWIGGSTFGLIVGYCVSSREWLWALGWTLVALAMVLLDVYFYVRTYK